MWPSEESVDSIRRMLNETKLIWTNIFSAFVMTLTIIQCSFQEAIRLSFCMAPSGGGMDTAIQCCRHMMTTMTTEMVESFYYEQSYQYRLMDPRVSMVCSQTKSREMHHRACFQ